MDVLVSMLCFKIAIFLCSGVSGFLIDSSNSPLKNPVATQSSHRNCSLIEADVVFLLDASGSVGSANFFQQLNLVKTFVENSNIGPSNVQVSVVTFSTRVQEVFNLSRYQSKEALLSSMNTIKYSTGSTHTSEAILYAVQHSFTHAAGDRPLVPNFLFVVTDGHSTFPSHTTGAANLAHQAGIITFIIGIGSSVSRQELQDIATSPQHVFQVPDFNVLSKLHSELTTKICEVPKAISTTTITSTAIASSVNALSSSVLCSNKLPRCGVYGRTVCSSYVTWAKVNCPLYCGFCTVSTMYVTIPTKATTTSMDTTKTSPTTTLPSSTTKTELTCPACDENLNCVWNRACFHGEVCMIRQYHNTPFTVHCSKKQDCIFMKTFVKGAEIMCCEDHQCISHIVS
ncbi:collagen alpha-1(XII) chain-like isoform X1 [Crassostrea angulata]|uniref:collagen alpha-1(XII) chain-like isoform X1 n=1 Tax=Magallana angulata TaxID=2784310 RepID=UPI0022B1DA4C|nr:collagen alpha-1(XII) chain-like isoform X1 [Crassostrea angulata]